MINPRFYHLCKKPAHSHHSTTAMLVALHALIDIMSYYTSQDAKVDLKPLIVAVMPIYCLSETINLFFFLFLCVYNKLIIFSAS